MSVRDKIIAGLIGACVGLFLLVVYTSVGVVSDVRKLQERVEQAEVERDAQLVLIERLTSVIGTMLGEPE